VKYFNNFIISYQILLETETGNVGRTSRSKGPSVRILETFEIVKEIQSVYKRTYIKSPVELCGSIFFLAELCQAVEAGKLDVK
jgi:hypothetical protein